jgi:malate dehydrogenase (quinone)
VSEIERYDLALVGGGIMSATLGALIKLVNPKAKIVLFERLDQVALESSNPWHNAGTGHAALCELNYMPDSKDGSLPDPSKAIHINEQFQVSRQFWAAMVQQGVLSSPESFIRTVPHVTFVRGEKDADYLSRRFEALKNQPLFAGMQFSEDPKQISKWAPLIIEGRAKETIAATFIEQGTDVDYGAITQQLITWLEKKKVQVETSVEVTNLHQYQDGSWQLSLGGEHYQRIIRANKVFVGAGGWALKLLQKAGIREIDGYGTFPVSGHFLRTDNPELVAKHQAKVYSQAQVGAPPMSVPHLDTRVVDGKTSLLFGPFAGLNPKFLKFGSLLDLPLSVRLKNVLPYLSVALKNFDLVTYLIKEVTKSRSKKIDGLREFVPNAKAEDWSLYEAGQRAQVIKPTKGGGTLQFGTEVIAAKDGTIAGLLGASPGASVAVSVMLDVIDKMYPNESGAWRKQLTPVIPSLGRNLNEDPKLAKKLLADTAKVLKLKA